MTSSNDSAGYLWTINTTPWIIDDSNETLGIDWDVSLWMPEQRQLLEHGGIPRQVHVALGVLLSFIVLFGFAANFHHPLRLFQVLTAEDAGQRVHNQLADHLRFPVSSTRWPSTPHSGAAGFSAKQNIYDGAKCWNNGNDLPIDEVRPIPINLAVNAIAVGYALKALEPATRLFYDFGASTLSPSGYALAAMIFTFMIIQIVLAAILVRLNLENFFDNGRFKFLSFVMTLVASISLILLSTKTLMQEGERYYLE